MFILGVAVVCKYFWKGALYCTGPGICFFLSLCVKSVNQCKVNVKSLQFSVDSRYKVKGKCGGKHI